MPIIAVLTLRLAGGLGDDSHGGIFEKGKDVIDGVIGATVSVVRKVCGRQSKASEGVMTIERPESVDRPTLEIQRTQRGFVVSGARNFEYAVDLDWAQRALDNIVIPIVRRDLHIDLPSLLDHSRKTAGDENIPWTGLYLLDQWRKIQCPGEAEGPDAALDRTRQLLGEWYAAAEKNRRRLTLEQEEVA